MAGSNSIFKRKRKMAASASNFSDDSFDTVTLLSMPREITERILSLLSFHNIAELRLICTTLNYVCKQLLNRGFTRADKIHDVLSKKVKTQLPRRESERRNHHLARHVDILSSIETRLSLMNMTYMKYLESGQCCFIPGKVLDELYRLLRHVDAYSALPRPHEFLMELRDISSMAMEHFEEVIVPRLVKKSQESSLCGNSFLDGSLFASPSTSKRPVSLSPAGTNLIGYCENGKVRLKPTGTDGYENTPRVRPTGYQHMPIMFQKSPMSPINSQIQKDLVELKQLLNEQKKKMVEQTHIINQQNNKIKNLEQKCLKYDNVIGKLWESVYPKSSVELYSGSSRRTSRSSSQTDTAGCSRFAKCASASVPSTDSKASFRKKRHAEAPIERKEKTKKRKAQ